MNRLLSITGLLCALTVPAFVQAQIVVQANPNHEQLLASPDTRLAANKRLVYDFWREVVEAGHMELADKYMEESYIQHNPNVPTSRAAFVRLFSKSPPKPIEPLVKAPLVSIVADGDFVVLSFVRDGSASRDVSKHYTTTWFDMFRVQDGKIAEHWDGALKP